MGRCRTLGYHLLVSLTVLVLLSSAAGVGQATSVQGSFDRISFEVVVNEDGSARWTFRHERTLGNDTERDRFEAFAADFEAGETALFADFRNQSRALASRGREETGRPMEATDFARRAHVSRGLNTVGVVELSFTWTAFAETNASHVIVGDVFEGGLYLGPDQSLVVAAGNGLHFAAAAPAGIHSGRSLGTSDTVTWRGEQTFTDNRPRVVLSRSAGSDPGAAGSDPTGSPETDGPEGTTASGAVQSPGGGTSGSLPIMIAVAVVTVFVVGVGAVLYFRQDGVGPAPAGGVSGSDTTADAPAGGPADDPGLVDDHQRIDGLLRENDGRMRQSAIVEETGWSKSKVSMVLSEMEEEDRVTKIRIGRENLVSLPGYEPEAAGSPYG